MEPIFPPEVWSNILAHTDDHTVWSQCRRVSRMLRSEAERDFRTSRLNKLKIRWTFSCHAGEVRASSQETDFELQTSSVKKLSDDKKLAVYGLQLWSGGWYVGMVDSVVQAFDGGKIEDVAFVKEAMLDALGVKDGAYLKRLSYTTGVDVGRLKQKTVKQYVTFQVDGGTCEGSGRVPWKDVDLGEREISVDWRRMLDDVLGEEHVYIENWS
ncbi:Nn.00g017730.m01.CDS01 [Neocucurbitaria sp. VM-36]